MQDIQGRLHVARRRLTGAGGDEGVRRGKVGMGTTQQPTNTADKALIGFTMPNLGGGVIGVQGWSNQVNGNA